MLHSTKPHPRCASSHPPAPQDILPVDRFDPCIPTATCNGPCCTVDKLPPHLEGVERTASLLMELYALVK